ncbi:PREDICTED: uncharacterized protein LOC109167522 [Ipomoea nil]|uniref:uncharacterized protein LOC109167522 n=1 Tax=Ipomoea nil TaxID=35883 RepID=UPI000901A45F|nr:PREDICTED: uncharacterized protein LOC109167522 [Ipomoea nil]
MSSCSDGCHRVAMASSCLDPSIGCNSWPVKSEGQRLGYGVSDSLTQTLRLLRFCSIWCSAEVSGLLSTARESSDGIIGFGQENSSFISQLTAQGKVKKIFSHCLNRNGGGILAMGQVVQPKVKSTPLEPYECSSEVSGLLSTARESSDEIIGFGQENSSFISQLTAQRKVKKIFSHCLNRNGGGILAMGQVVQPKVKSTPLEPYEYVMLSIFIFSPVFCHGLRCSSEVSGLLSTARESSDGIIGFGQENSSFISQLMAQGKVKKIFSHCLNRNGGGILAMGQVVQPKVKSTPLEPYECSSEVSGLLSTARESSDGIIGFGQENSSFISQLMAQGKVKKIFSHCLNRNGGGILAMGQVVQPKVKSTPREPYECSSEVSGLLSTARESSDGIIGFGQENSSFISQLTAQRKVKKIFSHCLNRNGGGILAMGQVVQPKVKSTPLEPYESHYTVILKSIEVGGVALDIQIYGGVETIIDSGTTFAYFSSWIYDPLVDKLLEKQPGLKTRFINGFKCFDYHGKGFNLGSPTIVRRHSKHTSRIIAYLRNESHIQGFQGLQQSSRWELQRKNIRFWVS